MLNNPIRFNDPTGHVCSDPEDPTPSCDSKRGSTRKVSARIYYLNAIGYGDRPALKPKSDPDSQQAYILYRLGLIAGPENVTHIPIYTGNSLQESRWEMYGEMFEQRTWSPVVASTIIGDLEDRPLSPGESLILVGNSGGGTVAIESLDLLEDAGIHVDQVILLGSPVKETVLKNVGQVDYITSNFDPYYSIDINPFDAVEVQEHRVDFWGHTVPDSATMVEVVNLMISLITP